MEGLKMEVEVVKSDDLAAEKRRAVRQNMAKSSLADVDVSSLDSETVRQGMVPRPLASSESLPQPPPISSRTPKLAQAQPERAVVDAVIVIDDAEITFSCETDASGRMVEYADVGVDAAALADLKTLSHAAINVGKKSTPTQGWLDDEAGAEIGDLIAAASITEDISEGSLEGFFTQTVTFPDQYVGDVWVAQGYEVSGSGPQVSFDGPSEMLFKDEMDQSVEILRRTSPSVAPEVMQLPKAEPFSSLKPYLSSMASVLRGPLAFAAAFVTIVSSAFFAENKPHQATGSASHDAASMVANVLYATPPLPSLPTIVDYANPGNNAVGTAGFVMGDNGLYTIEASTLYQMKGQTIVEPLTPDEKALIVSHDMHWAQTAMHTKLASSSEVHVKSAAPKTSAGQWEKGWEARNTVPMARDNAVHVAETPPGNMAASLYAQSSGTATYVPLPGGRASRAFAAATVANPAITDAVRNDTIKAMYTGPYKMTPPPGIDL
jgi:hypothetical protein